MEMEWSEKLRYSLYDHVALRAGKGVQRGDLFCSAIGAQKQDAVHTEDGWFGRWLRTNITQADPDKGAKLPTPNDFLVGRLGVLFLRNGFPLRFDQSSLYGRTAIQFSINAKVYWQSPAWNCVSPFALVASDETKIKEIRKRMVGAGADFPEGILLAYQEWFSVRYQIDGPIVKNTVIAVHLDGILARPIQ